MDFHYTWESSGGETVRYRSPRETRHIYELVVEITSPDFEPMDQLTLYARWCAQFTTSHTSFVKLRDELGVEVADLAIDIMRSAKVQPELLGEVRRVWDIGTGAVDYDPEAEKKLCECPKCKGLADESSICRFNGVTERGRLVSEWAFFVSNPQYWDKPYSVYMLAKAVNDSKSEGMAADRQKREEERGEGPKAEDAKKRREAKGHKW